MNPLTINRLSARLRRRISSLALIAIVITLVSACAPKGVPEGFDKAVVIAQARTVISQINAQDYASVEAQFSPEMTTALPPGALKNALDPVMAKLGAFKEFKSETTGSGENKTIGKYAVIVIRAGYENGDATYTISIDQNQKLTGLFVK